jgi:hypothetical protein
MRQPQQLGQKPRHLQPALGYLPEVEPALRQRFDHVLGTLCD